MIIIKTVLVDDEYNSLQRLKKLVKDHSDFEIIALYQDSGQLLEEIDSYLSQLDLVFLDIEMPGIKGLELAEIITSKNEDIEIIFVTAYNEYAVEAFEINALDYLLKPISKKRFKKTIARSRDNLGEKSRKPNQKLQVATFSQPELKLEDGSKINIKWPTAKVEELFYYLLRYEGEFVAKAKIIDQLWPESSVERARDILYTTIYNLRKTLKKLGFTEIIISKRGYYKVNLENIDLDTVKFKNMLKDYKNGELKAETLFKKLREIYQGEYLAQRTYNWLNAYRIHLKNEYIKVLNKLNENFRTENKSKLLKESLKRLIELDPLAENSFKKLIKIYKKEGNQVQARRCYKKLQNNLWQELKIAPDFKLDNC